MEFLKLDNLAPALWVGQTRLNMTSQRVIWKTYYNTTWRSIEVSVSVNGSSWALWYFTIDWVQHTSANSYNWYGWMTFVVPAWSSYKVSVSTWSVNPNEWAELR